MPKRRGAKGTKVTLKFAKMAIMTTPEGRRRLKLSNMGITIFPKCLLKLTDVDELDISRNLIQKLPEGIGSILSLQWLDLHSNRLESVPESIGNLVGLTHLNLCNNRLTSGGLPSTLGYLTSLKSLNLGMNQLDDLPPTMVGLGNLQELGLFDNLFINLPEFLKVLGDLSFVNMKRNPLSYLQEEAEKSETEEDKYLIHESSLCRSCLKRCKEQVETCTRSEDGEDVLEEKRMRTYSGLLAPNSVAQVDQDVWRIREVEHKPIE